MENRLKTLFPVRYSQKTTTTTTTTDFSLSEINALYFELLFRRAIRKERTQRVIVPGVLDEGGV